MRNNLLDISKGFAILWIIVIHTVWWAEPPGIPGYIKHLTLLIDVPLFFFLSGWSATYQKSGLSYMPSRVFNLYLRYFLMIVLLYFVAGRPGARHFYEWAALEYIFVPNEWACVLGSMWFLQVFIIIYALTPLFRLIGGSVHRVDLPLLLILTVVCFTFTDIGPLINKQVFFLHANVQFLSFYAFFYFLGMISPGWRLSLKTFLLSFGSSAIILAFYLYNKGAIDIIAIKTPPSAYYMAASMMSIAAVLYLRKYSEAIDGAIEGSAALKSFRYLGKRVYSIYLYQGFGAMIAFFFSRKYLVGVNWPTVLVLNFLVNAAISLFLAEVFHQAAELILGRVYRATSLSKTFARAVFQKNPGD